MDEIFDALEVLFATIAAIVLVAFVVGALGGWLLMLAMGALHGYYPAVAPIGYWAAAIVAAALGFFIPRSKT